MSDWGLNANDFAGKWKLLNGYQEFEIKGDPLKYFDSATKGGAGVLFDPDAKQLDVVGKSFGFRADGYCGAKKEVEVVRSSGQSIGDEIPTEGERYTHEET